MKKTEQRWMHASGRFADRGLDMSDNPEYELVTVVREVEEWEEVEVNADPQSPNSVWYRDECGVTRQVPRDAKIIAVFRRLKPEPEAEVLEGSIQRGQKYLIVALPIAVGDRTDLLNKKVEVRVR